MSARKTRLRPSVDQLLAYGRDRHGHFGSAFHTTIPSSSEEWRQVTDTGAWWSVRTRVVSPRDVGPTVRYVISAQPQAGLPQE